MIGHSVENPGELAEPALPTVLYIAGYGRSGSTVLDMLLGGGVGGLGEVVRVFEAWRANTICSCGRGCRECVFWSSVMTRVEASLPHLDMRKASLVTRQVEGWSAIVGTGPSRAAKVFYGRLWRSLFACAKQVANSQVLIDSSKSDRRTARRAISLATLAGLDVRVVHLVRDPRAVAWSVMRGSNRLLELGCSATVRGGAARALLGWTAANFQAARIARRLPSVCIRYEDLVDDPLAQLHRTSAVLGLRLDRVVESARLGESLRTGHGVAGNRLRRYGGATLRADNEWSEKLPAGVRILAAATWPLAHRHGYVVV